MIMIMRDVYERDIKSENDENVCDVGENSM